MRQAQFIIAVAAGAMLLAACSKGTPPEASPIQPAAKRVAVTAVQQSALKQVTTLSGVLKPSEETLASFEAAGRIVSLAAKEGDYVEQGSLLASLDSRDLTLQVESAAASVQQAQAQVAQVTNGAREEELAQAKNAEAKAKVSLDKAQADLKRTEELFRQGALSQSDWETAQNRADLARKDWDNAKQSYSLVVNGPRQEVKQQTAGVYQQAIVGQQRAVLSKSKADLAAPISGVVLEKLSAVGQLATTGTQVYRIGQVDTLLVELAVPDRDVVDWKTGQSVSLALYEQKRTGTVSRILPSVSQQSGTVEVEVLVPNAKRDWLIGQVVTATHERVGPKGLFVPIEAVLSKGEKDPYVFVVRDQKAVKVPVAIGLLQDNQLQITSGLSAGDQLVTKGMDQLFDGDPLDVISGDKP